VRHGEDGRKRVCLRRREAVAGERNQRRRLGDVADDPDPLEAETVGDRGAGTFKDGARAELTACQRASQRVQCLELDVRFGGYGNPGRFVPQGYRV
jgi:hypothetical protein